MGFSMGCATSCLAKNGLNSGRIWAATGPGPAAGGRADDRPMVGRRFPRDGLNAKLCAKVAAPSSNRALNPPTTVSATPLPVHKITAAPARRRMAAAARLLALLGLLATGTLRAAAEAPAGSYEGIIRLAVE